MTKNGFNPLLDQIERVKIVALLLKFDTFDTLAADWRMNRDNGKDYRSIFNQQFQSLVTKLYQEQEEELARLKKKEKDSMEEEKLISR